MKRVVRATLFEATTSWYPWVLVLLGTGLTGLQLISAILSQTPRIQANIPVGMRVPHGFDQFSVQASLFDAPFQVALLSLIGGILLGAGQSRLGAHEYVHLAEPRRGYVVAARMASASLLGLLFAVPSTGVAAIVGYHTLAGHRVAVAQGLHPSATLLWNAAIIDVYAMVGCALGCLSRSRAVVLTASLVWTLVAESLLLVVVPFVGRWSLGGVARVLGRPDSPTPVRGAFSMAGIPADAAAATMVMYVMVSAVVALVVVRRRDFG